MEDYSRFFLTIEDALALFVKPFKSIVLTLVDMGYANKGSTLLV